MRKVFVIVFLLLLSVLLTLMRNAFTVSASEFRAVYSINNPVIDGSLGNAEWNDATRYTFMLLNLSSLDPIEVWAYFKHNGTYIHIGLVVWQISIHSVDEFAVLFDEGADGGHGSGTRDGVLTPNQEDLKSCVSSGSGIALKDGYYQEGTFTTKTTEIDFLANCTHENDHSASPSEIEYWELGGAFVDDHWECEFAIPFVGNDSGVDDVSDLNCDIADIVGIKFQYFFQPATNHYYPVGSSIQIETYTSLSFSPQPTIETCTTSGALKDIFSLGETVYVNGSGYLPSETYDLYVVADVNWTDGMAFPARISGTAINVTSDSSGEILPTVVWTNPQTAGKYDVAVDVNGNGVYDVDVDALDNNDVQVTAGFTVPELSSLLILSMFMMVTLLTTVAFKRKQSTASHFF